MSQTVMDGGAGPTMIAQGNSTPANSPLTACQTAERYGLDRKTRLRRVRKGKAPQPDEVTPFQWTEATLDAWEKSIPSPEHAIEELKKAKPGDWKVVGRDVNKRTVPGWIAAGLVVGGEDVVKMLVNEQSEFKGKTRPFVERTFVRDPRTPAQDELTAAQIAERWGVSISGLYTLVREKKAPRADSIRPWRWKISTIDEWEKTIPSVEEARAKLQRDGEQKGNPGPWERVSVMVERGDFSWDGFYGWIEDGLLSEGADIAKTVTRGKRRKSTRIVEITFVRTFAINLVQGTEHVRRSESRKRFLATTEKFPHGKDKLLTARAAARFLKVDRATLERWSDPDGAGCHFLCGRKLTTVYCDKDGSIVLSKDEGVRCWFLSELVPIKVKCNSVPLNVKDHDGVYSPDEVCTRTGITVSTLCRKDETDALGLVRVELPVMSQCKRKLARSGLLKTGQIAFTQDSVDAYAAAHPNLQERNGSPGTITTAEATEELGIKNKSLVSDWCRDGLLQHNGIEEYWTKLGLRKGYRPTKASVKAAKIILDSVGGDVFKAAKLLRASKRATGQVAITHDERPDGDSNANADATVPSVARSSFPELGAKVDWKKKSISNGSKPIEFRRSEVEWHFVTVAFAAHPNPYTIAELKKDYPVEWDNVARKAAKASLNRKLARIGLRINEERRIVTIGKKSE